MRHRRMQAPINSIKHYVHRTNVAISSAAVLNEVLTDAVTVASTGANSFDVSEGSLVKAIHLDYWVLSNGATATNTQFVSVLEKVPSNQAAITAAQIVNLGAYPNKKNILNSFQGNMGAAVDGQSVIPFMQGWFKIPKGKQRQGLGDRIVLSMAAVGQEVAVCGLSTYKEYT